MVLKLYYNSVEETNAVNITVDLKVEAKSIASFDVSRLNDTNWIGPTRSMQFKSIQIYDTTGATTVLIFEGFISSISPQKTLLHCECEDIVSMLAHNIHIQSKYSGTDFILYEGKVSQVSTTTLVITTNEGVSLDWVNDAHIGDFVIISDENVGQETVPIINGEQTYIGLGQYTSNLQEISGQNYADVDEAPSSSMGDPWTLWKTDSSYNAYGGMKISCENYTISPSSSLISMVVATGFTVNLPASGIFPKSTVYCEVIFSPTSDPAAGHVIWTSPSYVQKFLTTSSYDLNPVISVTLEGRDTEFFASSTYWDEGFIFLKLYSTYAVCEADVEWNYCGIDLTYSNTVYAETNDEITSNGTNIISWVQAKDSDGNAIDFAARNVSVGDSVSIVLSIEHAYDLVGNGMLGEEWAYTKSYPEDLHKGFGKVLNGVNSLELWEDITGVMDHLWYVDYRLVNLLQASTPILTAKDRADLEEETTVLSGFMESNIVFEDQEYSKVVIFGSGGDYVQVPTTSTTSIIPYKEIRKDFITETERYEYASKLATKMSDPSYSIELTYNKFVDAQVGYKVPSITIINDYGDDTAYTNQIIRRVTYAQDSANGAYLTKIYLGRGMTPLDEKIGHIMGTLKKRMDQMDAVNTSRIYSPSTATRHSDLNGILPSSSSQYHLLPAEHALIHDFDPATKEAANANIQSHISNDAITTAAHAQAACIETVSITEDLTTKSPSSQLVFDGLASKTTLAAVKADADVASAISLKHTQNTDTGTNAANFAINGSNAIKEGDARLTDARTPTAHTQAESTITSAITAGNFIKSDGSKLADSGSKASDFATSGHNHDATYAPIAKGVTNGDSHDHSGGDGAQIAYSALSGLPTLHDAVTVTASRPLRLSTQLISVANDADAEITEIDTGTLDTSDTKVPTNGTVKEAVDLKANIADPTFTTKATAPYFVSSVATGTQPFQCTSTTKNANLNAEQVDGADLETTWTDSDTKISSSKAMATKAQALIDARLSAANATNLTDGNATTLHKHSYNNLDDKPTIPDAVTVEDTPTDGHTTIGISSNVAFDIKTVADAATTALVDATKYQKVEDEGNFKHEYGFDWGSTNGAAPTDWSDSSGANCTVTVVTSYLGHNFPMKLDDQDAGTRCFITSPTKVGTYVSCFIAMTDVTQYTYLQCYEGATLIGYLYMAVDKLYWYGASGAVEIMPINDATWYHIALDFNVSADTVRVYVNGTQYLVGTLVAAITTSLDSVAFVTRNANTGYQAYIDAVYLGTSWLEMWSSYYDGQVADRARWTQYGERQRLDNQTYGNWHFTTPIFASARASSTDFSPYFVTIAHFCLSHFYFLPSQLNKPVTFYLQLYGTATETKNITVTIDYGATFASSITQTVSCAMTANNATIHTFTMLTPPTSGIARIKVINTQAATGWYYQDLTMVI